MTSAFFMQKAAHRGGLFLASIDQTSAKYLIVRTIWLV